MNYLQVACALFVGVGACDAFGPYRFRAEQSARETRQRPSAFGYPTEPEGVTRGALALSLSTVALITQAVQIMLPHERAKVDRSGDA